MQTNLKGINHFQCKQILNSMTRLVNMYFLVSEICFYSALLLPNLITVPAKWWGEFYIDSKIINKKFKLKIKMRVYW